jgi:hypothetical protein
LEEDGGERRKVEGKTEKENVEGKTEIKERAEGFEGYILNWEGSEEATTDVHRQRVRGHVMSTEDGNFYFPYDARLYRASKYM